MKRREFLHTGALAWTAVVAGSSVAAQSREGRSQGTGTGSRAPSGEPQPLPASFDLDEATIATLQDAMTSGQRTSRAITQKYLDRIQEIDRGGPTIHSVIEINPDALAIAEALDEERKAKGARGPLHGIPVLIKDNIDTSDRMMTTAGSLALIGSAPSEDAHVVKRLREAGAVILGKTNLSEWANFRSSHSSSGWSGRGGQTKNPYALDRNPCGSSSGSGAAASANLCVVAVGTETDGSIVCPSSANSLVGIKPTLGLISRTGIIPIAHSQDTAGPMARTVTDAAVLLGVLAGMDTRDAATVSSPAGKPGKGAAGSNAARRLGDYTKFLLADGLRGARLGIVRRSFGFSDDVDRLMNAHIETMKTLGAVLVDPADIPTAGKFDESELEVLLYEFKADLNRYLSALGPRAPVRSLKDIIDFNERNRDKEMRYFGQDLLLKAEEKGPLTESAYLKALRKNHELSRAKGIDLVLRKNALDALIAPTGGPSWPTDWINGDHFTGGYSSASAVAGYPHITVPAGYVHGLPVGISFFASAHSEPTLIKLAFAFEQATQARRPPRYLPTANLEA